MIGRFEAYGEWLRADPTGFGVYIVYLAATVLLSLILHECAHGYVALCCGDPTAKLMGRLTLDPRKHLDPIGTVFMFALGFGWAKPVPVNPRNFRELRRDYFLVSVAGIAVNLSLFVLCTGLSVLINWLMLSGSAFDMSGAGVAEKALIYNSLGDMIVYGSASLPAVLTEMMNFPWLQYVQKFLLMMRQINLALAVFNLIPVPPLDGYRLLDNLTKGRINLSQKAFQVIQAGFLVLCLTGLMGRGLSVVTGALDDAVTNLFLLL